jgi:hypothetical protein
MASMFLLLLSAGCVPSVTDQNSFPPASQQASFAQQAESMQGKAFGYGNISIGMMGLPGRNDVRPGFAVNFTIPPAGMLLVGFCALIGAIGSWDFPTGFGDFVGLSDEKPPAQGVMTGNEGPFEISGIGWDCSLSLGSPEDLTFGGHVGVCTLGTGVRYIGGLWRHAFWNALLGVQGTWMNFDNRPNGFNYGVYGGVGVEFGVTDSMNINTTVRYAILTGDMPQYDYWDATLGLAWYW